MAWVEGETWNAEQGTDALKTFELVNSNGSAWTFVGWDVNATISDERGRVILPVTVDANPSLGTVRLIVPEATVNGLKVGGSYRYDCLMVPPGATPADDHYLATGLFTVALRTTRRDP